MITDASHGLGLAAAEGFLSKDAIVVNAHVLHRRKRIRKDVLYVYPSRWSQ